MRNKFWMLIIFFFLGIVIVALPDEKSPRLIEISPDHGPSLLDLAGLTISITCWGLLLKPAWHKRKIILAKFGLRWVVLLVFLNGLGTGMTVASVKWNYPYWWIIGAIISFITFLLFIFQALKKQ